MITKLNLHVALNSLSIGNCGFNIVRELYRRKVQCAIFVRGQPDFSAYKLDQTFGSWMERSINSRYLKVDRSVPTLACWHVSGSEFKPSDRQYLLSFHETDSPTETEVNIVNQQHRTFFSSNWTVDNFRQYGANNVDFVPLGLDEDFTILPGRAIPADITHWILVGKAEQRKNTQLIITEWVKRYGANRKHRLTLCVTNPFFQPPQMEAFYQTCFAGKGKPFNVNILPYLRTNVEVNQLINSADIDLSGFSGSEGWGLPAFTATALGKWSIVSNCTAHKDWATAANSVLVETTAMRPVYDNVFFQQGGPVNQGNIFDLTADQLNEAMTRAEKLAHTPNEEGRKLAAAFTWKRTVDEMLAKIEADSV